MKKLFYVLALLAMDFKSVSAQEYASQIGIDKNTCKKVTPDYLSRKNNPLYAKALTAQRAGRANQQQIQRIRLISLLESALRTAKCKIPK